MTEPSPTTEVESGALENMDEGIRGVVRVLQSAGVVTIGSCQGGGYGWGHGYLRPTVEFHGGDEEGPRARTVAEDAGFIVFDLHRRYFEAGGSNWVLQFVCGAAHTGVQNGWGDKKDQWSPRIAAAHPMITGDSHTYAKAMEMVGNRRSKAALVELVNWLLKGQP